MGKSNRPDDGDRWEEEPKDTRRRLALQQRDGDEDDVDTDCRDDCQLAEGARVGRNSERGNASDEKSGEEDHHHHGVDGLPPLDRPVNILQVKQEGELVDCQCGADAEDDRNNIQPRLREPKRDSDNSREEHGDHAEDDMVDVEPSRRDVVKAPLALADLPGDDAHDDEGHDHRQQHEKRWQSTAGDDLVYIQAHSDSVRERLRMPSDLGKVGVRIRLSAPAAARSVTR